MHLYPPWCIRCSEARSEPWRSYRRSKPRNKNSILRASLFRDEAIDPNEIMGLLAHSVTGFWRVLIANIEGVPSDVIDICPTFERGDGEPYVP